MRQRIFILFSFISTLCYGQDTTYLKVHFLYGSKPLKKYQGTEKKWFGGVLGGHVGIEGDSDKILNFLPSGRFHWFAKNDVRNSTYMVHSADQFYAILGSNQEGVKKAIVYIPISQTQKEKFDSLSTAYLKQTPYDYALMGMRCGAAAYDILAQLNILKNYSYRKTFKKIFYPKKLRKRLFRKALEKGWTIIGQEGSTKRKWEKD
jgi:hypothetical protein